jgi:Fe-coproporphyrin III synthase
MPTGDATRVLQLQPTLACDLGCRRGDASSGPKEGGGFDPELLRQAIADAAEEGYGALSVSGGEPLLYASLPDLLDEARAHGMATAVTTNGMRLDPARLEMLRGRLDYLAISLDGIPESHDRLCGRPGAFAAMEGRLEGVREAGLDFGFLFTLTRSNAHELGWIAAFALAQGAGLLQIHPLEEARRAAHNLRGETPDDFEAAFAWVVAMRLRESLRGRLRVHLDLLDRAALPSSIAQLEEARRLSELVSPLVVEADGAVVPLQFGFPRAYALGCLDEARLSFLGVRWRAQTLGAFAALCRRTFEELSAPADLPFVLNWYEEVARRAVA